MLCFRLFNESTPAQPLAEMVAQLGEGHAPKNLYAVEPTSFQQIPNAPFAYWVSESIRRLFSELPSFEGELGEAKQGIITSDDFRFVRAWWESVISSINENEKSWFTFAKGGGYSPYYGSYDLVGNWGNKGGEILYFGDNTGLKPKSRPQNVRYYFKPGFTWSYRPAKYGSFRILPRNVLFSANGSSGFLWEFSSAGIFRIVAIMNSKPFNALIRLLFSRGGEGSAQTLTYEVGYVGITPIPPIAQEQALPGLANKGWSASRRTDTATLTSHAFHAPALAPGRKSHTR